MAEGILAGERISPVATKVYVVDSEPLAYSVWRRLLPREEFEVLSFAGLGPALAALEASSGADVLIVDLDIAEGEAAELLPRLKAAHPDVEIVLASSDEQGAAQRSGAYHVLGKPFDRDLPALLVRQAAEHKRLIARARELEHELRSCGAGAIVGSSLEIRRVRGIIAAAAASDANVLIAGEAGSGREHVGRAIHEGGPRRAEPLVAFDCAAPLPEGGWPGRTAVFLANVHALGSQAQLDLLHRIEAAPETRVLAACDADLEHEVRAGRFDAGLYLRLNAISIRLPALRDRRDDVPALAYHFIVLAAARLGRPVPELEPEALAALVTWKWPGNVRELEEALARAVVCGGERLTIDDLPDAVGAVARLRGAGSYRAARQLAIGAFDRAFVDDMLSRARGNISEAARLAGLDRANFKRIMRRVGRPQKAC